jgi:hypothetical protein
MVTTITSPAKLFALVEFSTSLGLGLGPTPVAHGEQRSERGRFHAACHRDGMQLQANVPSSLAKLMLARARA